VNRRYKVREATAIPDYGTCWETTDWMDAERAERCAAAALARGDKDVEIVAQDRRSSGRWGQCRIIPASSLSNNSGYAINALDG